MPMIMLVIALVIIHCSDFSCILFGYGRMSIIQSASVRHVVPELKNCNCLTNIWSVCLKSTILCLAFDGTPSNVKGGSV